ncbi:hypothetical protein CAPTEDRAFT_198214 [Capitella teleta]|uniref:Uncharacterized protein n=1 Tax=Capitella teleta TaxID=283909 RepID=R7TG15_CAPTE|nr:hypothetical protein CAPTEDRAFT_198214 [Capitella teleta]|eukprot:ELT89991.1 hypothetical protein CAPTEDRAFT_198214 [Capitella teleta]
MPAHAALSTAYSREQKQGLSLYGSDWSMVESLIANQTAIFKHEIKSLREEVSSLRAELVAVNATTKATQDCVSQLTGIVPGTDSASQGNSNCRPSFREVVSASVKTPTLVEKSKNEVVIMQLPENKNDNKDLGALCSKICISVRPTAVTRLGERKEDAAKLYLDQ